MMVSNSVGRKMTWMTMTCHSQRVVSGLVSCKRYAARTIVRRRAERGYSVVSDDRRVRGLQEVSAGSLTRTEYMFGKWHGSSLKLGGRFACNSTDSENNSSENTEKYEFKKNTEFGYSRKDIILIGVGLIALGYGLYYGLQTFAGLDPGLAGNWVQLIIFLGICVGWIGSYLFRVATKQMTYVKQLEDYEEEVMKKRLEEMPEAELESLMEDIETERKKRQG